MRQNHASCGVFRHAAAGFLLVLSTVFLHGQCVVMTNVQHTGLDPTSLNSTFTIQQTAYAPDLGFTLVRAHDNYWQHIGLYGYNGVAWYLIVAGGPTNTADAQVFPQQYAAMVYDSARHKLLVFGGRDQSSQDQNILWSLEDVTPNPGDTRSPLGSPDWKRVQTRGPTPPAASEVYGAFDPIRGRSIFILTTAADAYKTYQVWEWDGAQWSQGESLQLNNSVNSVGFTFDPIHGVGLFYAIDFNSGKDLVWYYGPFTSPTWQQPPAAPAAGIAGTLVTDIYRGKVLRCCGPVAEYSYTTRISVWDYASSSWQPYADLGSNGQDGGEGRGEVAAAFDANRDVLVIAGGYLATGPHIGDFHYFSDTLEATDLAPGIVSSSSGTVAHCAGDSVVFSITVAANSTNQIQWYHSGVPISGAASPLLVLNNVTTRDAGNYVARVLNDCGYLDTPKTFLRVDVPITLFRQALFPECSQTCIGANITIHPPLSVYTGIDLSTHLQKNIGSAGSPTWVDVRVDTPLAPADFVFTNVDKSFSGDYRFYIDGSACSGIVASITNRIQVGFDIASQPQSLSNVRPCSTVTFSVGTRGGCSLTYQWFKYFQGLNIQDDGHFTGATTPTLTINGVHYDDEAQYGCLVVDTNQCNNSQVTTLAGLKLALPQWVLRTTNGPSPRRANAMAYDSARGVTVMYSGGFVDPDFGYTGYGDLWEWDGARWRQRTTYNWTNAWHQDSRGYWVQNYGDTPAARMQHAMAYDSRRGRVVMFGGRGSDGHEYSDYMFNDTWEWDGTRWYFRTTNGPPGTFDHHMTYDPVRGVTVLCGGVANSAAVVWEWDGNTWTAVTPTSRFPANIEQDPNFDFDTFLGTVFAGVTSDDFFPRYYWTWDGHDWHPRAPGFESFSSYTPQYGEMVYDTYRQRSFHFGGLDQTIGFNGSSTSAYYDSASDSWMLLPDAAQTSAFSTTDFWNASQLAVKLTAQADPVSQYLWSQFDSTTKQVLTNSSSTFDQLKNTLSAALNNLINHNIIFDSNRFYGVTLSPETQVFQVVNPQHKDLVRFNRLLLEDAYPADIVRSLSTPPGRYYFGMAFDWWRRATIVMGGYYNGPGLNPLNGSDTWELMYLDTPLINDQPASQYRAPGDIAVFNVNAVAPYGSTLTYDWYFGRAPLSDGGRISGAHSPTLRIANVNPGDAGQYQARISAACGTISTVPAILTTDPGLQIFSAQLGAAQLVWSAANLVLQQADSAAGPWTTLPAATSPFDLSFQGPAKFFRLASPAP